MPSPEEIEHQRDLLTTHRRSLAHLLKQAAQHGGEVFAPPQTANGIAEARKNIQHVTYLLRSWDVEVDEHPDDMPSPSIPVPRLPPRHHRRWASWSRWLWAGSIIAVLLALVLVTVLRSLVVGTGAAPPAIVRV